jgi:LysR family transcriptional regulator, glycine cleavage system transcriptional activator
LVDPALGLHFNQTVMALQAATDGQGVALGNTSLVADDLAAGRLVKPFDLALKVAPEFGYYLVTPRNRSERPLTKAFREWLLAEIESSKKGDAIG